jgi:GNAT superfamily N-acetyltransferase
MLSIRPATAQDVRLMLDFIRGLAEYERAPELAVATGADLLRDGFGPQPRFHCIIAEWEGQPAGFAFYFYNYSTWRGRPGLYLEDLFVWPHLRGKGIGKALLVRLAQIALRENCGRFEWAVLDWNEPAIQFYESLGARKIREWIIMRVEGDEIAKLANQPSAMSHQQ